MRVQKGQFKPLDYGRRIGSKSGGMRCFPYMQARLVGEAMQIRQGTQRAPNKWGLLRRCGMGAYAVYAVCTRFCEQHV